MKSLGILVIMKDSETVPGMGVFFQAIHPVEYSRPITQAMAEELIQPGGLGSLLCTLFTDDVRVPKAHGLRKQAVPP